MSDVSSADAAVDLVEIDIRGWGESASANPDLYRDRQVTEIVLTAIGLAPSLRESLVLKGGALMALGFASERLTADVDFTAEADPEGFGELLTAQRAPAENGDSARLP